MVQGLVIMVWGSGSRVQVVRLRAQDLGFGFRV
jgi:hypothetical protein